MFDIAPRPWFSRGKACVLATYEKIAKLDGVAAATVDFQEGRVIALVGSSKTIQPAW